MAKEVFMPKNGMDMHEGRIIRWLFEVGDHVTQGEPLLEIETDKVTMEVDAPSDGILLCRYFDDGAVVPVITVIGYIGEEGEEVPAQPPMAGGAERQRARDMEDSSSGADRRYDYEVAVIGGGPAGYTAALRAASLGKRAALFEKDSIGGTDVNRGSISLKYLLKTAAIYEDILHAGERGIHLHGEPEIRFDEVKTGQREMIARVREGIERRLSEAGVDIIRDEATLIGAHHIKAGLKTYTSASVILCCGSAPRMPEIPGSDIPGVIESGQVFDIDELPERVVILGGGVTGCELASAFAGLGSQVTLIEQESNLLPTFDREARRAIENAFRKRGVRIITEGRAISFEEGENGPSVHLDAGEVIEADLIVYAYGRVPFLEPLGTLRTNFEYERGKLAVDEFCRTNIDGIYACGDMTNRSIQAHSAMKMGDAAASAAAGFPKNVRLNRAPLCLYTSPEAAGIGLTESEAASRGEIMVGRAPLEENARAISLGETEGFVKVIADRAYGEILGVHIVGAGATELIVEAKTMMDMEITVHEVSDIMHPHPSRSEAFMQACADAIRSGMRRGEVL